MIRTKHSSGSYSILISVVLLYLILMVLVVAFANEVLTDLAGTQDLLGGIVVALAVLFPLFLLAVIGIQVVRLIRERAAARPGVNFKIRLLFFFFVVVVLSSIPQAILSINFINTTFSSWYDEGTGEALRSGRRLAIEGYNEQAAQLETFSESVFFRELMQDVDMHPARVWENIRALGVAVDGFQVFDNDMTEVHFAGAERTQLRPTQAESARVGSVARDTTEGGSFLRIRKDHEVGGERYTVILSTLLPAEFETAIDRLSRSVETFTQIEALQDHFLVAVMLFYLLFGMPLLLLALLVSMFLSEEIIRPVVHLDEATRRVAEGDYSYRVLSRGGDDLAVLAESFNRMVGELERSRRKTRQAEKIAAWQEIARRLAHEIKNPLTPIRLSAERILRKYRADPEAAAEVIENGVAGILREVQALDRLLTEFRSFSRLPAPELREVNLRALLREAINAYGEQSLHVDPSGIPEDLTLPADPNQLKQVFANLFKNAAEAGPDDASVRVRADLVRREESRYCRIQVRDDGPGISGENQAEVFHPYFTTKRDGTGLGLAIVERIVFDHDGQIWIESEEGAGTTIFMDLPLDRAQGTESI